MAVSYWRDQDPIAAKPIRLGGEGLERHWFLVHVGSPKELGSRVSEGMRPQQS